MTTAIAFRAPTTWGRSSSTASTVRVGDGWDEQGYHLLFLLVVIVVAVVVVNALVPRVVWRIG